MYLIPEGEPNYTTLLLIGGFRWTSDNITNFKDVDIYHLYRNGSISWVGPGKASPVALSQSGRVTHGKQLYIAGGYDYKDGAGRYKDKYAVLRYDVLSDAWKRLPSLSEKHRARTPGLFIHKNILYLADGNKQNDAPESRVYSLDLKVRHLKLNWSNFKIKFRVLAMYGASKTPLFYILFDIFIKVDGKA